MKSSTTLQKQFRDTLARNTAPQTGEQGQEDETSAPKNESSTSDDGMLPTASTQTPDAGYTSSTTDLGTLSTSPATSKQPLEKHDRPRRAVRPPSRFQDYFTTWSAPCTDAIREGVV
jgi:hypothetical protein